MNKINNDLREILIVLTGVDINKLASEPVNIYPLKYIWKRDNMRCIICNRTWDDKIKLERHHFIPVKLGKYFGLTKEQMNNELNLGVMCQEHHCEKDLEIRRILHELFFNIWKEVICYVVGTSLLEDRATLESDPSAMQARARCCKCVA